jgi:hypothetical protein
MKRVLPADFKAEPDRHLNENKRLAGSDVNLLRDQNNNNIQENQTNYSNNPIYIQNLAMLKELFPHVNHNNLERLLLHFGPTIPTTLYVVIDELTDNPMAAAVAAASPPLPVQNRPTTSGGQQVQERRGFDTNPRYEEFLRIYPNSRDYFYDRNRNVSENYRNHCRAFMANTFRMIETQSIEKCLNENNWILILAYKQLQDAYENKEDYLRGRIRSHLERHAGLIALGRKLPRCKLRILRKIYRFGRVLTN